MTAELTVDPAAARSKLDALARTGIAPPPQSQSLARPASELDLHSRDPTSTHFLRRFGLARVEFDER